MDAARTHFSKTALFFATALLTVVPGLAQTAYLLDGNQQTTLEVTAAQPGYNATQVTVASTTGYPSGSTEISFTATVTYNHGDQPWLSSWPIQSGQVSLTTGNPEPVLSFSVGVAGSYFHSATILLHAAGVPDATITVDYPSGTTPTSGTLTPSATTVYLSAASGASTSGQVNLTNNSGSPVSFTIPTPATSSGGAWLTASANVYTVASGSSATLTVYAPNGVTLSPGTYYGTVSLSPSGTVSPITVQFTVGSGGTNGNLTANPSSFSWSFTTNSGVYPTAQTVGLSSLVGATTYTASVDSSSDWLEVNGLYPNTSGYISNGLSVGPNPTYMSALGTGTLTGYVHVTDQNGNPALITVTLVVNGGTASGITWNPDPVVLTAALGGSTVTQTVNLTSATAGTFTVGIANNSGTGLSVSGVTTITTTTASVIVYGVPGTQAANTYYGTLSVTVTPTSGSPVTQNIQVSFVIGSGGSTTTAGTVTPTSLTFAYQKNSTYWPTPPTQTIQVTGTGTLSVGTITLSSGSGWLSALASGPSAPGTITVNITPGALAASSTLYTATIPVTVNGSLTNVSVSLLVTSNPVLEADPGTLTLNYTAGGSLPSTTLYVQASDGPPPFDAIAVTVTTSTTWLTVGTPTLPNTNSTVLIQGNSNLASLPNGVYLGTVTVTATTAGSAANTPVNVPVLLTVSGSSASGGNLSLGSLSTFTSVNGATPASQTLTVGSTTSSTTYYTASASNNGSITWLSISPSGSLNTTSNSSLTVSVINASSLTVAGSPYTGTITFVANGITQTVTVTLVVSSSSSGGTGNVTATPTSINFGTYTAGGSAPAAQNLVVASASGSAPVSFTISSSANWVSAGVTNGTSLNTPVTFTVSIVSTYLSSLSPGLNSATITITPNGGTVVTVPVSLTVQTAPTVTATSTPLSFTYQVGGSNPATQTVAVSGGGQSLGYTAAVTLGSAWLSVSPTSGTTPTTGTASVTVTVTPGNMAAGSYTGTILVSGTSPATGSTSITVNLTITAPLPTIISVKNAASGAVGAVSPGEIVSIYGTNLGPASAAYAALDPTTGKLATTIGGVQVLFSGIPAPLFYAGSTQVNAVVPYEMALVATPTVLVKYVGQTSNGYQLTTTTTAPGIFTQNSQGTGPGAILNQDGVSVNGPGNPAAKGSIVTVYMTGEGVTSCGTPSLCNVTGKITTATLPPPQVTPAPLLPVGVLINGLPALPVYAGEAPGFAAGLMQLNVQIPSNAQSGNLSITVSIGSNISQTGVTVTVQ
jgi:uncharacterized protein (TIGR03437 family)